MNKRKLFVLLFFGVLAAAVFAQDIVDETGEEIVEIKNNTEYEIATVYASPSGDGNWGNDLLGGDVLKNGDSVILRFSPENPMADSYDIRLISSNGAFFTKWNVPVQPNSLIEFIKKDLDSPLYAHVGVEFAEYLSGGWGFGTAGGLAFNVQVGAIIHPINLEILAELGVLRFAIDYTLGGLANYYLNNWFGFGAGGGISAMTVDSGDIIVGPYIRGSIFAYALRLMKFSVNTDYFINTGGIQVSLLVSVSTISAITRTAHLEDLWNRSRDSRQKMRPR